MMVDSEAGCGESRGGGGVAGGSLMRWRRGGLGVGVVVGGLGTPGRGAAPPPARVDRYGEPLPPGAVARLGTVRWRFTDRIDGLALVPGGRQLVSYGVSTVAFWDVATGRRVRSLRGAYLSVLHEPVFTPD